MIEDNVDEMVDHRYLMNTYVQLALLYKSNKLGGDKLAYATIISAMLTFINDSMVYEKVIDIELPKDADDYSIPITVPNHSVLKVVGYSPKNCPVTFHRELIALRHRLSESIRLKVIVAVLPVANFCQLPKKLVDRYIVGFSNAIRFQLAKQSGVGTIIAQAESDYWEEIDRINDIKLGRLELFHGHDKNVYRLPGCC